MKENLVEKGEEESNATIRSTTTTLKSGKDFN